MGTGEKGLSLFSGGIIERAGTRREGRELKGFENLRGGRKVEFRKVDLWNMDNVLMRVFFGKNQELW